MRAKFLEGFVHSGNPYYCGFVKVSFECPYFGCAQVVRVEVPDMPDWTGTLNDFVDLFRAQVVLARAEALELEAERTLIVAREIHAEVVEDRARLERMLGQSGATVLTLKRPEVARASDERGTP